MLTRRPSRTLVSALLAVAGLAAVARPALAIDEEHKKKGEAVAAKAIAYLKTQQDAKSGGWNVPAPGKNTPQYPAITGLVVNGLLMDAHVAKDDPAVASGVSYILSMAKPDGGIYDTILPTYNTSICLSAIARVDSPKAKEVTKAAQNFLRNSQWGSPTPVGMGGPGGAEAPKTVGKDHPFYGGVGYGRGTGRPDLSNTQFMLQALADSGVPRDDPAVQRALVFLAHCQMNGATNDLPFAKGSHQGGFVYGVGNSEAEAGKGVSEVHGMFEETMDDGSKVSKLRAYGSMSYAGFKSYLYAGLQKDDPRVLAVLDWMKHNYSASENPGLGLEGYYYYAVAFARALSANGSASVESIAADGATSRHDWQNDLIDRLAELQQPDGSFKSVAPRFMENNNVLITAYGLLSLENALH